MTALVRVDTGVPTSVGSLPHTDAREAATFVLDTTPELPAAPQLPNRSPREWMLAQVGAAIDGVDVAPDGSLSLARGEAIGVPDEALIDDLAWGGLFAFLDVASERNHRGPVKVQVCGPVTLALALVDAGVRVDRALPVAREAVRSTMRAIVTAVSARLGEVPLVAVVDEPSLVALTVDGIPFSPVDTVDSVSTALAAAGPRAITGIHCCGTTDWRLLLQAGPDLVSFPAAPDLGPYAGALASFLDRGGLVAWGVIPTDGPIGDRDDFHWRHLTGVWCELTRAGCDPILLRTQALVTPACGLALHRPEQVPHVFDLVRHVAERVQDQAVATRLSVGA